MEPATATLIAAALTASGSGLSGYLGGKASDAQSKIAQKNMLLQLQEGAKNREQSADQFAQTMMMQNRRAKEERPGSSLAWLNGISNLQQGLSKPTGLDVMRLMAGG